MDSMLPELKAMADIASIFAALEEEEVQRVLKWANEKYRFKSASVPGEQLKGDIVHDVAKMEYTDIVSLFDAAKPANGLERILVGAYYCQVVGRESDFDSQSLNNELKHLGYPSSNITRDMESLVNRSPKLVIQTRKEGTTQQARKKFRLTMEGMRAVETMLSRKA